MSIFLLDSRLPIDYQTSCESLKSLLASGCTRISVYRFLNGKMVYAVFSISPGVCSAVRAYIAKQKEHHRKVSYRDELVSMLDQAKIEFDPEYLE